MGNQIDGLTCGQLSGAAYHDGVHAPPPGWQQQGPQYFDASGNNSFTVFVNPSTRTVDFSFRGADNAANFKSILTDGTVGGSAFDAIKPVADSVYNQLTGPGGPDAGYTVIDSGHSLGGLDAAGFALDKNISGCAVDPLPIPNQTLNADFGPNAVTNWKNAGNQFSTYTMEGDITNVFRLTNGTDISTSSTTYKSPYAVCEEMAVELAAEGEGLAALLVGGVCLYENHKIDTELNAAQNGATIAQTGDTATVDSTLAANMSTLQNDVENTTLSGPDSNVEAVSGSDYLDGLSVASTAANGDTYTSIFDGSSLPLDAITDTGFTVTDSSALVDIAGGGDTTIYGNSDTVAQIGDYGITSLDGSYDSGYMDGSWDSLSLIGYETVGYANGYFDVIYYY